MKLFSLHNQMTSCNRIFDIVFLYMRWRTWQQILRQLLIGLAITAPVTIASSELFCVAFSVMVQLCSTMRLIITHRYGLLVTACFVPGYVNLRRAVKRGNQFVRTVGQTGSRNRGPLEANFKIIMLTIVVY
jgi:hypothetical protein